MKPKEELFEQIERYLNNEMSSVERDDFEHRMDISSELKQEVHLHGDLVTAIKDTDSLDFRSKLIKISRRLERKRSNLPIWRVVIVVLILLGTATYLWFETGATDLFEKYYTVFPVEDVVRGDDQNRIQEMLSVYSKGNYGQAIPQLDAIISENPDNHLMKLYLGSALLETGGVLRAISVLKNVNDTDPYYEHAQWYLALAYIKNKDNEAAKDILGEVIQNNGIHAESARSLLNELK